MKPLGFVGLALSPGIAALFNFTMLALNVRSKIGSPEYAGLFKHLVKVGLAAVAGAAVTYIILNSYDLFSSYLGVFETLYRLGIGCGAGVFVYLLLGYIFEILKKREV